MPTISTLKQQLIELPIENVPATIQNNPKSNMNLDTNLTIIANAILEQDETTNPAPAFQILNTDFLGNNISAKPNAIVRPVVRRNDQQIHGQKLIAYVESQQNRNDKNLKENQDIEKFTKELDTKLKRLKKDAQIIKSSSKNGSNQGTLDKRPLFITTVPKGVFLQPIKDLPFPSRRVYAFSSRPRIFTNRNSNFFKEKYINGNNDKDIGTSISGVRVFNHYITSHKPRETQSTEPFQNLMYDKRVVRGTNYGQNQTIANELDSQAKETEARRRQALRKRVTKNQRGIIGTPPPVYGRKHENVQTEKYLEELFEKPTESEVGAQTDLFLLRPPSPPFVPAKVGIDISTEIGEGDLFDVDMEVEPIIEMLVGYSIEQALLELHHEEEILEIKQRQEELLALREVDLAEMRRLEAEEVRLQSEKTRRVRQDEISKELDEEMQERVTAAKLLQGYVANILPNVLKNLEPLTEAENREELERKLCPWLSKEVAEEVGNMIDSRDILTEIIKEILKDRAKAYQTMFEGEKSIELENEENVEEENLEEGISKDGYESDLN